MSRAFEGGHFATCDHCGARLGRKEGPLTPKQSRLYDYLERYDREHGYAPSFEEIALHFKYASLATVHERLNNLEVKGWIQRGYNQARAIRCLVRRDAGGAR